MYNLEQISAIVYLANYGMRIALGSEGPNPWTDATEAQRDAYRHGVLFAITHQPTSGEQHDEWVRYHEVRNPDHPNLVPWQDLSPGERDKDAVFLMLVRFLVSQP